MNAFEIEITIQSKSGESSWPLVVRCKQPDGLIIHSKETLQLNQDDFNKLIAQHENEKEYGIILGKAIFQGAVRETFIRALSKTTQSSHLRILLSIEVAENDQIKTLHWERLCAPIDTDGSWHLLARDQRVPFSLYIPTLIDRYFPPMGRRDLRALVLVASPSNLGKFQLAPFDVQAVLSGVKESFGDIPYDVLANNIEGALGPPTLQELSKQLTNAKKPYTLLHFVCHGKLLDSGETVLYWATEDDRVLPVPGEELLGELKNIGNNQRGLPQFTFLCSCESADPRAEGALGGLAQRLVRNLGMPAVVAMTRKVSVETALALGRSFYKRLRESGEVDVALQEATAGLGKRYDITVPALFSRLGGRPLFSDRLEDRELTDEEIEYGIDKVRKLLEERAPHASVLLQRFETQVKTLKNTQGADSRIALADRIQAILELDNICDQLLDLSFDALAALGKEPPEYKAECPFPGLFSFGDKRYHKFFFGRDELVQELQKELIKENFLAVIGASGSGKSSVVLAGLIPKLKEQEPSLQWVYLTPGKEPLKQLERRLERLLKVSEQHSILVVDQFEELFTLCEDKALREAFIEKLFHFAEGRKVVITMRADFLGECTFYPELRKRIETRQKLVGPMEPAELVIAMKMQADSAGLRFEAGLSHAIFNDVQGEPGVMPLLQYALQELWKRRRGRWLCSEEYQAIGGVQQAIAKTADDFYNSLSASEQEQVRNIFLRLTRLDESALQGEKRRDTRRRVELEALVPTGSDLSTTKKLVQQLAGEGVRLVVTSRNESTGKEEVEVAHEALIRYWPMLQNWLNQNRSDLQLRQTINQGAEEWLHHHHESDKDSYLIHQGGRLEDAEKLLTQPKSVRLNQEEAEYVLACVELRDRIRKQEEQRRRRQLIAATSAAFILGGFAIFAGFKWREADIKKIQATLESADARLASNQTLDARIESLQAAKALKKSFWQTLWPEAGLRNQVMGKLSTTIYAGQELNRFESYQKEVYHIAFSPDGKTMATSGTESLARSVSTIVVWDISSKKNLAEFKTDPDKNSKIDSMAFSPKDSKLLVTAGADDTTSLWDTTGKKLATLEGHKGEVKDAEFSRDGKLLVTAGADGTVILSDTTGKKLTTLKGHKGEVKSAMFSPDGKLVVTLGKDNVIYLWDTSGKKLQELSNHQGEVKSVAFSPNSKLLVTAEDGGIVRVRDTTGKELGVRKKHQGQVNSVAFSPDGKQLVTGGQDNNAFVWDTAHLLNTKGITLNQHQGDITNVAFSLDSKLIVTGGKDDTIRLWDTTGKQLFILKMREGEDKIAISRDGTLLATGGKEASVRLWDTTGKQFILLQGKTKVYEAQFRPNTGDIITLDEDGIVRVWNKSGKQLSELQRRQGKINYAKFSPNGKSIVTRGQDGTASLWDISGKKLADLKGHQGQFNNAEFSPDGKLIVIAGEDGTARLWDTSGKQLYVLKGHQGPVFAAEFSPDGKSIITAGEDGTARLWDTQGKQLYVLKGHQGWVWAAEFSPDGKSIITAGEDGTARLWDTQGKELYVLTGHRGLVWTAEFSRDGKYIITGGEDGTARLWDTSGKPLPVLTGHRGLVTSVDFSADSKLLVTGGEDGTTRLWDISGKQLAVLKGHQGTVENAASSKDGKSILTLGKDGTARLWKIGDMDELLAMNCDWVRDYLKNPTAALIDSDRQLCDGIGTANNPGKAN